MQNYYLATLVFLMSQSFAEQTNFNCKFHCRSDCKDSEYQQEVEISSLCRKIADICHCGTRKGDVRQAGNVALLSVTGGLLLLLVFMKVFNKCCQRASTYYKRENDLDGVAPNGSIATISGNISTAPEQQHDDDDYSYSVCNNNHPTSNNDDPPSYYEAIRNEAYQHQLASPRDIYNTNEP